MFPGFDSWTQRHMNVEFVVGSRPCSEGFLWVFRFSSLLKNQHFQIPIRSGIPGPGFVSLRLLFVTLVKQSRLMLMQLSLFRLLSAFKLTQFSLLPTLPNMMQSFCSYHCNAIYILTVYDFTEDDAIAKVLCD